MTEHERFQEMAGAYVLGALETADRHAFERHLDSCEHCRREVSALAPIPGLLRHVDGVEPTPIPTHVVDGVTAEAVAEWRTLHRSRRWWRWTAVAAMTFAVALAVVMLRGPSESADLLLALGEGPVTGEVAIDGRTWGSALELELDGLPARDRYVAWVVDRDGDRQQAASWGPTPTGHATLAGAAAVALGDVAAVVITDADGIEIAAFPADG